MPRPRLAMRKIREVLRLALGEGLSVRDVGLSLGVPRSTVSDHLKRAELAGVSWPLPESLDDDALEAWLFPPAPPATEERPQPDFEHVHKELRRKGVTLLLLWLEYKEQHPDGYQHSQFCDLYRRFKGTVDVVMRQEHRAGEKVFVDFPGQLLPIYDRKTGALRLEAELFVAVLGASSYLYAEAVASQQLGPWVTAHVHAFEFFGAVPAVVVPENVPRNIFGANALGHPAEMGERSDMTVEKHLLGLVEVDAVEPLATRREPDDEHPGVDHDALEEEAHLPEVDLGLLSQQVGLGNTDLWQCHRTRLLDRSHIAAHTRLAHLGVVFFDQTLEDPPCRVPLLPGHVLVVGQPSVDGVLPGSERRRRALLRRLPRWWQRRVQCLAHHPPMHLEPAGKLTDRRAVLSGFRLADLLEQFHPRPLCHRAQAPAHRS